MTTKETTEWINEHRIFYKWWKKHRHSGFVIDDQGRAHWGDEPWVAYQCDQYRTEFSIDTGSAYEPLYEYSAEEIERWAQEQKDMENHVKGDYRCIPRDEAQAMIEGHLHKLKEHFKGLSDEARGE